MESPLYLGEKCYNGVNEFHLSHVSVKVHQVHYICMCTLHRRMLSVCNIIATISIKCAAVIASNSISLHIRTADGERE